MSIRLYNVTFKSLVYYRAQQVLILKRQFSLVKTIKPVWNVQTKSRLSNTARALKLDSNNILSSPFADVSNFDKTFLHDYIWSNIGKWPDKIALECAFTGRKYTYSQLRKQCSKLASSFSKANLLPGSTIAILMPNIPEMVITILAASEAGIRVTTINPICTPYEIEKQLINAEVNAIFSVPERHDMLKSSIKNNHYIKLPIVLVKTDNLSLPADTINFFDLVDDSVAEYSSRTKLPIDYEDPQFLLFSSGTTGLPKAVMISHRNIVANLTQLAIPELSLGTAATATHQEIVPLILPLFHIYGLLCCLLRYLYMGAKIVCLPQFTPDNFFNVIEKHKPTLLYLVPPMVQMLSLRASPKLVESVQQIISGAAPLGEETVALFKRNVSSTITFGQGYGLTETSPVVSMNKGAVSTSAGTLLPNTQIRIVGYQEGNRSQNLGIKEEGEIYVRGPQVMMGYYKNPQATCETMEGDWLKTGDLAYFNEEGLLFITGRLKELIKVQGFQVAPAELEDSIRAMEKVQDVGVIGVPHEKFGEIPKAFIVPKPNVILTEDEVKNFVKERFSKYKHLGYVQFIDKIPQSPSGKILRKELKKL
ncbi:uncharacterized protein [Prorops nasuta]|uniref:uncharacterized protein n=1 Tax=Prorops nasuta TaxID=863751 RepID=UPI0034CD0B0D